MMLQRRDFLLAVTLATAAVATPVLGQTTTPAARQAGAGAQSTSAIPDFSGIWAHPMLGFEQPLSGPGPVRNMSRQPNGTSNNNKLVGDYNNPILKPAAAEVVRKRGEVSLLGLAFADPDNQCVYQPVPYVLWNFEIQILPQRDKVTILYNHDHEFRQVRLNQSHPAQVTPSWLGDSVGHYEGDTLVVDTVGIRTGLYSTIDRLGTPYTQALHVVERYRFLDYEAAKEAQERGWKEWANSAAYPVDPDYKGKGLQLEFTVEDDGVFTMPWSAIVTYRRALRKEWDEHICAENVEHYPGHKYYVETDAKVPSADKPDF